MRLGSNVTLEIYVPVEDIVGGTELDPFNGACVEGEFTGITLLTEDGTVG